MSDHQAKITREFPELVTAVIGTMEDKKAFDVVVLDLRNAGVFADFFVVGSGQTKRQVKAIGDAIETHLKERGMRPSHIEGYGNAEWILMDCFDVIVHVFTKNTRQQYELERLWGNSTLFEITFPDKTTAPINP